MNNKTNRYCLITLGLITALFAQATHADKPLWEIAVGIGGAQQAYYNGSKQTRTVSFPVIFPVYRGDFFKSDDKGIRAELFKDPKYKLDVSFDFNFAVNSSAIELREGMADIENLLQIGPALEVLLQEDASQRWQLNFPLRIANTINDASIDARGYTFSPGFSYYRYFSIAEKPWRINISPSIQFGSADYHDIYYGVDKAYATANRSAYETEDGYSGFRLSTSLSFRSNRHLFVAFTRYDNIDGAAYDDSPLVETKENWTTGFLYSYYIFKSKRRVTE